jgi:hypothetical protein
MPTKPARTKAAKRTRRYSLVSAAAQQQMYQALSALNASQLSGDPTGAEVAEIAFCLAAGERTPIVLACPARGARTLRSDGKIVSATGRSITAATLAAIDALLADPKADAALVCAGQLETQSPETRSNAQQDYRAAFRFAARHKLPILYLVANRFSPGKTQEPDLRTLYAEFGIPLFSVDANDAIAAYRVATEALHNARHLRGPCIIEALTIAPAEANASQPLELLSDYMKRHGIRPR